MCKLFVIIWKKKKYAVEYKKIHFNTHKYRVH